MIKETFKQAVQNVLSNKVRTFLTMLGIIIGVMAVIVIVGLGNGMTNMMQDFYSDMGSDILSVNISGSGKTINESLICSVKSRVFNKLDNSDFDFRVSFFAASRDSENETD